MKRLRNAARLMATSWRVMRQDRELLLFPLLSLVVNGLVITALLMFLRGVVVPGGDNEVTVAMILVWAASGFVCITVTMFFDGALIAGAYQRMSGDDPTVPSALRDAFQRIGAIVGWSAITFVMRLIFNAIQNSRWCPAKLIGILGELAWEFATFLTLPAIIIDYRSPTDAMRRSTSLVKSTWGENISGHLGFGLAGAVVLIPAVLIAGVLIPLGALEGVIGAVVLAAALGVVIVVFPALLAYYKTALYLQATDGVTPDGFADEELRPSLLS